MGKWDFGEGGDFVCIWECVIWRKCAFGRVVFWESFFLGKWDFGNLRFQKSGKMGFEKNRFWECGNVGFWERG